MRRLLLLLAVALLSTAAEAQLIHDIVHATVDFEVVDRTTSGKVQVVEAAAGAPDNFNGVAIQGFVVSTRFDAEIRFRDGDNWTAWEALYIVRSPADPSFAAGWRSERIFSPTDIEVRFTIDEDARFEITAGGVFDSRRDEDAAPSAYKGSEVKGAFTIEPPPLIMRADWGAEPFRGEPVPLAQPSYDYFTFHHAAGFSATSLEDGLAQVRAIQDLHQNIRGWSDIGYQFVIDRAGRLYQGRPFLNGPSPLTDVPTLARGAHVGERNSGNIGICLLGCYHPPEGGFCEEQITTAAMDTYVTMFAFLSEAYEVELANLRGHRDFSNTACPGDNNYVLLPSIREAAEQLVIFGNEIPSVSTLERNYPNPVSGTTSFRYFLQEDGIVRLNVYDLTGRLVANVVDAFQEGNRRYTVPFDASALSGGVYLYRIQVEGFAGTIFEDGGALVRAN